MSLHSLQRRHPWIMAPSRLLNVVTTPERWPLLPDGIANRITRRLAFDTTGMGRAMRRLNLFGGLRDALLPRSAALRALDWQTRKAFWTLQWCMMVAFQGWPRRAPRPRQEKPIRLLSAPETYADFQSPTLVVPETVPHAEKSLLNQVTVQVVHLLQDLYPVVARHQEPAHPDPQERLRRAYTLPYRLVRNSPRWHPDLVAAAASKNLLGALASGGPFAKLLERVDPDGSEYTIDLRHFAKYDVREGFCPLASRVRFDAPGGRLVVTAIEYDGDSITPESQRWDLAERIAIAGLNTHVTVWRQGMEYHVGGLAPVPVLTHNLLPPAHPLRRLLAAHINQTMTTNVHTHLTLRRSGFDVTGFTFPYDTILRYYDDGAAGFDINRLDVEEDARRRGIPDSLEYPYLPQALRYYRLFETYVRRYVEHAYPAEDMLQSDADARAWFDALDQKIVRGVRSYVPELTREGLVKLCTLLIYSLSVGHTENSLVNHAVFMPTTVRRDGVQPSVGEIQNIVNFQFLITAPSTLLISDVSHLALDATAAKIMRAFRDSLLALQDEMERQPSRHWQLFPRDVEASVSC
jgi:arachidonate 15-lipoxygenase